MKQILIFLTVFLCVNSVFTQNKIKIKYEGVSLETSANGSDFSQLLKEKSYH